ncbi:hypothetical protein BGX29_007378 [Mortierella sp. GBA35]|nr:hypothetical protein BGX29_007378 [Mortierella sp. GBA35]
MDYPGAGNTALRAHHSLPTMTPSKSTTSVVFVGNPGVGKSTLLNALGGNFANGMTPLGGLTKKVSSVTVNCEGRSLRLIDVPGIMESGEDNTISGNLQMLEDTLNSSGRSVLFFVVTPRNGRIAPDDFAVMKTLLTNLSKGPMVGLIITQVKRRQIPTFQSGDYYNKILGILQSAGVDTTYFEMYRWLILEEHDYDFDAADRRAIRDYVFCFSPQEVKVRGFMAKMFGF